MRRSKGFSLIELMTAMVVYGIFLVMLAGSFYALTSFATRSQQVLLARERGRKVIDYIDQRIRTAGLGMWELESFSDVLEALRPLTGNPDKKTSKNPEELLHVPPKNIGTKDGVKISNGLRLPIAITYSNKIKENENKRSDILNANPYKKLNYKDGVWYGNILTLLYAERETDTTPDTAILRVVQNGINVPYTTLTVDTAFNTLMSKLSDKEDYSFWVKFFDGKLFYGDTMEKADEYYESLVLDDKSNVGDAAKEVLDGIYKGSKATENKINAIAVNPNITDPVYNVTGYEVRYKFFNNRSGSNGEFYYSAFGKGEKNKEVVSSDDIRAWAVSSGTGVPIYITKNSSDSAKEKQKIDLEPYDSAVVPNGDELLYLKAERLFTDNPTDYDKNHGQPYRNLYIQKPKKKNITGNRWGNIEPFETGILEIYMEMDEDNNIFHLWVLSTGGRDTIKHERPKDWPELKDPDRVFWRDDFAYEVLYVSKASWKLNNLHKDFRWNVP